MNDQIHTARKVYKGMSFKPEEFLKSKEFWMQLIIALIVIQGGIIAFAWTGINDVTSNVNGLKEKEIDYFTQQGVLFNLSGNPVTTDGNTLNDSGLSPIQLSVKHFYDNRVQSEVNDVYFYVYLLAITLLGMILTLKATILFFSNIEDPTERKIDKMNSHLSIVAIFIPISIGLSMLMAFISLIIPTKDFILIFLVIAVVLAMLAYKLAEAERERTGRLD